jgi:hypothetical protein
MPPLPFQISVPQSKIDILNSKLSSAQFPDELQSSQWDYGAPLADIQRLTRAYEKWDWRQAEEELNRVPQYTTGIKVEGFDELDVHFVWQKSEVKNAVPLLFVHGVSEGFCFLVVLGDRWYNWEERRFLLEVTVTVLYHLSSVYSLFTLYTYSHYEH